MNGRADGQRIPWSGRLRVRGPLSVAALVLSLSLSLTHSDCSFSERRSKR
jgi:hypothetical protein